jgi:hypothetical protein
MTASGVLPGSQGEFWLVLTDEGHSLALVSAVHAEGVVAPLYSTREAAEQAARKNPGVRNLAAYPAPPLWETARLLAAQGFAGLLLDEETPLYFVTNEPGAPLPTHIAVPEGESLVLVDDGGLTALQKEDVELWADLDAFDLLSIAWLLGPTLPFLDYQEDMLLSEYLAQGEPRLTTDRGMLLDFEPEREAVALFSAHYAAEWYWGSRQEGGLDSSGEIVQHPDIVDVLDERALQYPDGDFVLNPGRHRFYQGFFRAVDGTWLLVTINGVWRVEPPFRCIQVARRRSQ